MKRVPFADIQINDGFWKERQETVREKTIWSVYNRFAETGRIATMNCLWKEGEPNKPHIFWGSDVFKWMEGAAYLLGQKEDEKLRRAVNAIIEDVAGAVEDDGYYNSYFTTVKEPRFTNRDAHELYSAGHMFEAGVALYEHAGDRRLLDICMKNADLIDRIFRQENSAGFETPGHEEIELALVRLYHATGEEKYLDLAEHFILKRGTGEKDKKHFPGEACYHQSHLPVTEQKEAIGHSVRAVYLYCGMVDVALAKNNRELLDAALTLFDNIYEKQMYITGGIGSVPVGEKFGGNYFLPNKDAYAETCAALGFALFAGRLSNAIPDSRFGDAVERALYNGMISGLSLDGDSFFYENPLEVDTDYNQNPYFHHAVMPRQKVFECSCCPPNLTRLIPSVANFIYGVDEENRLFVHQYIGNTASVNGTQVELITAYPQNGKVTVKAPGMKLALRRPSFSKTCRCSAPYTEKSGYLYFDTDTVTVEWDMSPKFYTAANRVHIDSGKVALMRGPIVYCIESKDQKARVFDCRVDTSAPVCISEETFGAYPVLNARGFFRNKQDSLYAEYTPEKTPCTLRYIPFYAFANRGEDDMQVWVKATE